MTRKWHSHSRRLSTTITEQVALGFGNFIVSWTALRTLDVVGVSNFTMLWAIAWGVFAFISELILNPLRVKAAKFPLASNLGDVGLTFAIISLALVGSGIALHLTGFSTGAAILALCAIPFAAFSMYSARAEFQLEERTVRGFLLCLVYAVGSLALTQVASLNAQPQLFLLAGASSALVAVACTNNMERIKRLKFSRAWSGISTGLKTGAGFGLATLVRVVTYSVGFLALARVLDGPHAVAVYAAALVLISPSQIGSSALPWVLLPRLARAAAEPDRFRREFLAQLGVYASVAIIGTLALTVIWPWWTKTSTGDPSLLPEVQSNLWTTVLLMVVIILSSLTSTALHALHAQRMHLCLTVIAGLLALGALVGGMPITAAAAVPYIVTVSFGVAGVYFLTRRRRSLK